MLDIFHIIVAELFYKYLPANADKYESESYCIQQYKKWIEL